jgi:hypothetical protein
MRAAGFFLLFLWISPPIQEDDEVAKLLRRIDSESIEEREAASKKLVQMGIAVRSRIVSAMEAGVSERRARLNAILDAIDIQPESLPSAIEAILAEHRESFHQLVRHSSRRVRLNLQGKEWKDVKRILDNHRITRLKSSETRYGDDYETDHSYLLKRGAWRTPDGIVFDLRLCLNTRVHITPLERSREVVESAAAVWIGSIDKPLADLQKQRRFPRGACWTRCSTSLRSKRPRLSAHEGSGC